MPNVPSFVANKMESFFARSANVVEIGDLAPRLRKVVVEGASLRGVRYVPGDEIEFRVTGTALRHYTPSHFDAVNGRCEVLFYLHDRGPGSTWASALTLGAKVNVLGPGGRFRIDPGASTHVFLGDETCLGLFSTLIGALPKSARILGAVEVDAPATSWLERVGLPLDPVVRRAEGSGLALPSWVRQAELPKDAAVYLAGHVGSIQALRATLESSLGFHRQRLRTKPHWADGKRGL